MCAQILSLIQNVHTKSFINAKCSYQFFNYPKMCIPVLSFIQILSLCGKPRFRGTPGGNFTTIHYVVVKSLFKSYVERHKNWPNQHNMTKLQSNMANVHFFPSMSMGFANCSSGFNLTRTIVGLPDLSGSPHIPPPFFAISPNLLKTQRNSTDRLQYSY